jgi:2-oxoisovalerate dehydrogenase E1 component alpha subunit
LAVYEAVKQARRVCREESRPVLIEALTYRIGHHSTSDDSSAYRSKDEVKSWGVDGPINRFRRYLEGKGLWDKGREEVQVKESKKAILKAFSGGNFV